MPILKYYDGSNWEPVASALQGPTGPTGNTGPTGATGATGVEGGTTTLTNKGDLLSRDASNLSRLAVGANNTILVADSGETTGLKWVEVGEFIEATSTTTVTASSGGNIIYTQATITLTPGTWFIQAGTTQIQSATGDAVSCGIYNVTTSAEVSSSRGTSPTALTTHVATPFSRIIKVTVSSNTQFCPLGCRNGGSTTQIIGTNIASGVAGFIRGTRVA
jgi:hypothetical protein